MAATQESQRTAPRESRLLCVGQSAVCLGLGLATASSWETLALSLASWACPAPRQLSDLPAGTVLHSSCCGPAWARSPALGRARSSPLGGSREPPGVHTGRGGCGHWLSVALGPPLQLCGPVQAAAARHQHGRPAAAGHPREGRGAAQHGRGRAHPLQVGQEWVPWGSLHTVTVSHGSGQRQKLGQGGAAPARCWSLPSTMPGTRGPAPGCSCGCRVASGRSRSSGPPGL